MLIKKLILPITSNIFLFIIAIIKLFEKTKINNIEKNTNIFKHIYTTILRFELYNKLLFVLLTFSSLLSIILIISNYKEVKSNFKIKNIRLKIIKPLKLKELPEVKTENENLIDGNLKISLIKDNSEEILFQRFIRYGELIMSNTPGEVHFFEKKRLNISKRSFKNNKIKMIFEPNIDLVWTRNLYDKDNLHENLFDAKETENGIRQLLVFTEGVKGENYLNKFEEPEKVLRVNTGYQPYDENKLPNIFRIPEKMKLNIDNEIYMNIQLDSLQFIHDYCIAAILNKYIKKQLLHYSIRTELEIIDFKNNTLVIKPIPLRDISRQKAKKQINKALKEAGIDVQI